MERVEKNDQGTHGKGKYAHNLLRHDFVYSKEDPFEIDMSWSYCPHKDCKRNIWKKITAYCMDPRMAVFHEKKLDTV